MSAAQAQCSLADGARPPTICVLNCDVELRRVVEKAIQDHLRGVALILSDDFRLPAAARSPDIVLVNLPEASESCLSILPEIQHRCPAARVILLSGSDDLSHWTAAIQMGAYEFLPRSVECHQLAWVLQGALSTGRSAP